MRAELPDNTKKFIVDMPKVELHVHLEGAIPLQTLFQLIQRKGTEPSIRTLDDLRRKLVHTDFIRFAELWRWRKTFTTVEEDFEEIAYQLLNNLHQQNVKYVEVIFAPGDCGREGLSIQGITEYAIKGKERAHTDFGIKSELIVELSRTREPERGMQILDEITPYLGNGIIGISLGGREYGFPAKPYATVYREARERGFRLTAHAGEFAGADSICDAIENLGVERIGHGTRANEQPKLVSLIKDRLIPLEMCVTSNLILGVCKSIEEHPIREYFDKGLLVTVNSDDPTMFNTSITQEYGVLARELGFSIADLKHLSMNSIDASFMPEEDKESTKSLFEREWK